MSDDGGVAFPTNGYMRGMSLRDYFAAQALPALIRAVIEAGGVWNEQEAARLAYAFADAMLAERGRSGTRPGIQKELRLDKEER